NYLESALGNERGALEERAAVRIGWGASCCWASARGVGVACERERQIETRKSLRTKWLPTPLVHSNSSSFFLTILYPFLLPRANASKYKVRKTRSTRSSYHYKRGGSHSGSVEA